MAQMRPLTRHEQIEVDKAVEVITGQVGPDGQPIDSARKLKIDSDDWKGYPGIGPVRAKLLKRLYRYGKTEWESCTHLAWGYDE